ncbi:hypothetical protein QFZ75_004438 [Streptomyces sp. V3I8]|uniref:hypothetical protein n=1 Tax=Streptomyces sp. V3I8 TaxID=3042279 RepID=UPI0027863141|nr:hypothetical protein [Streptomyces sp. V3I8]MDQ1038022.1 hypothetical protein [Streptomyces sp. V3I8]
MLRIITPKTSKTLRHTIIGPVYSSMNPSANPTAPLHSPTPTTEPPPVWFLVPEGFFALPLALEPEERAERARSFVRELYSRGDERVWDPATPYFAAMAELMGNTGLSYAALGLFSTSEEEQTSSGTGEIARHDLSVGAAQCAFTLAAIPTDQADTDTDVATQGILATLSKDPYNEVEWLDLPCGPAASCTTWRQFTINKDFSASGDTTDLVTAQIQVYVPFPTGAFTAVFTLFTASVDHWAQFVELMGAVLKTVSFAEPPEALTETPGR